MFIWKTLIYVKKDLVNYKLVLHKLIFIDHVIDNSIFLIQFNHSKKYDSINMYFQKMKYYILINKWIVK